MTEEDPAAPGDPTSVPAGPRATDTAAPTPSTSLLARAWAANRYPMVTFVSVAAVLYATVALSARYLSRHEEYPIKEPLSFRGAGLLEGWVHFDGGWYYSIVTNGYFYKPGGQSSIAFFPGYPMLVGLASRVTGDVYLAGIVVTFLCGLGLSVVFYRWCAQRSSPHKARVALALLLVFPYAWYLYGAVYADALFVLCAVGAFYLIEKDRPILAGVVAAVATATRPVGIAMVVGMVAVLLEHRGVIVIPWFDRVREQGWWRSFRAPSAGSSVQPVDRAGDLVGVAPGVTSGAIATGTATATIDATDAPAAVGSEASATGRTATATGGSQADPTNEPRTRSLLGMQFMLGRLRPADFGVLLSLAGLLGWVGYLWATFGDPALFVEVQSAPGWDQGQGPSTWFKEVWVARLGDFYGHVKNGPTTWTLMTYTLGVTFQAALVLLFLVLIPAVVKRIGWGYAVYVLALIAIPVIGSKDWQGTGRYILGSFPVFLAVAGWMIDGGHVWIRRAWLVASAATLVFLTSAFARGYYLA